MTHGVSERPEKCGQMAPRVGEGKSEATHRPPVAVFNATDAMNCERSDGYPAWRNGVS